VLDVQQGDRAAAAHWVQASGLHGQDMVSFQNWTLYHSLAYVLVALGRPEEVMPLLGRLEAAADRAGATGLQIRALICEALAFQALGRTAEALESLARCLALAEPGGHIRSFVDQGAPMAALLQVHRAIESSAYVDTLLAAFVAEGIGPLPSAATPPSFRLPEPLSERELEVLRLIAAGRSNREIAETLVLALGTVKAHLHNIYGKLDAQTRTQALARARELKLL
jgi:LuxR family maltose regulon positive regulatory protein